MKANELRIGNYYICSDDNEIVSVDDTYSLCLVQENKNALPIPITEEWLLKLGFINHSSFTFIKYFSLSKEYTHELEFFFEPNEKVCISFREFAISDRKEKNIIFLENINYVHQLQNLYFALTSEELTLK